MTWHVARPNQAISLDSLPLQPHETLFELTAEAVQTDARVLAWFGRLVGNHVELLVVLTGTEPGTLHLARALLPDRYASLTPRIPALHAFERELAEQFGVVAEGHPGLHPLRFHRTYRSGHDAWHRRDDVQPLVGVMDFQRVEGDGIHEVAVGPVHAGVIEPGHFRFQCHGELVWRLEIALGYQHRGVEKALVNLPLHRAVHQVETLAGDTTIGHATAHAQAIEALAGLHVSERAQMVRAVALELERLAAHTGDLGALAGDVGYLPTLSWCSALKGDWLGMTALLCGSRFGRSLVRPGGVCFDLDPQRRQQLRERLEQVWPQVQEATDFLWTTPSILGRFEAVGTVPTDVARAIGLVGMAARASGLPRDIRAEFPQPGTPAWPVKVQETGDVEARARVRWEDMQRSVHQIQRLLDLPGDPDPTATTQRLLPPKTPLILEKNSLSVALVEGWRGEIVHVAVTDGTGKLDRYKVVDPSFHNWTGLAMALRGQQISDFPLCNKSFNLSYCGHDL